MDRAGTDRALNADGVRGPGAERAVLADHVPRRQARAARLLDEQVRVDQPLVAAAARDVQVVKGDPRAAEHLDPVLVEARRLGQAFDAAAADYQVVRSLGYLDAVAGALDDDELPDPPGAAGPQVHGVLAPAGPIFTWTRSRSTFCLQVQVWSVRTVWCPSPSAAAASRTITWRRPPGAGADAAARAPRRPPPTTRRAPRRPAAAARSSRAPAPPAPASR